jgi:hypothetical protein
VRKSFDLSFLIPKIPFSPSFSFNFMKSMFESLNLREIPQECP